MDSKDLRVIKTRKIIKNALIELMAEKSLSDISITELSEKALINRKTFYRHYRTVSDVVTEIENEILAEFAETLKKNNTSCLEMAGVIEDISALIERRKEYFSKLLKLNPQLFSKGRIKAMLRRAFEVTLKNSGDITDSEVCTTLSQFIVSGVLALYSDWFDGGCTGNLGKITAYAKSLISDGLKGFISEDKLNGIL